MKKNTLKLPRLKAKDELFQVSSATWGDCRYLKVLTLRGNLMQTVPEMKKFFGQADESDQDNMVPFPPAKPSSRLGMRPAVKHGAMETPRDFEEELTEEEILRLELEKVKHERDVLMGSIASAKSQIGARLRNWGELWGERGRAMRLTSLFGSQVPRVAMGSRTTSGC